MKKSILITFLIMTAFENGNGQAPEFLWAKGIGNALKEDEGRCIAVDAIGNIYTAGHFSDTVDFDPGFGTYNLISNGSSDLFISKSDNEGNFVWAKRIGGVGGDQITDIKIDPAGNILAVGFFTDTVDFNPDPLSGFNLIADTSGNTDVFILKLDNSGNFVWAKRIGGPQLELGVALCVDLLGNVYTTGYFYQTVDFDPDSTATFNLTASSADMFVSKLDNAGNFVWAKRAGGSVGTTAGLAISLDLSNNILVTGSFDATVDFNFDSSGTYYLSSVGYADMYVLKIDSAGNFIWARRMGGTGQEQCQGRSIATDKSGSVYTTGFFINAVDFDPDSIDTFYMFSDSIFQEIFILKLDSSGDFKWAKELGGNKNDIGWSLTVDGSGNIYTAGHFSGTADFDPDSLATYWLYSDAFTNAFISKLDSSGNFKWVKKMGGTGGEIAYALALDSARNVYVTGLFASDSSSFDPFIIMNTNTDTILHSDIFIAKLGTCSANFFLFPDTMQLHHYYVVNNATGVAPLLYDWNWGDGAHDYTAYPSHVYADSGFYTICLSIMDSVGCSSTYCDSSAYLARGTSNSTMVYLNVVDEVVTGFSLSPLEENGVHIYPNPADGQFEMSSSKFDIQAIEIYDMFGKKRYTKNYSDTNTSNFSERIDISSWSSGIYFVRIETEKGNVLRKLIIE